MSEISLESRFWKVTSTVFMLATNASRFISPPAPGLQRAAVAAGASVVERQHGVQQGRNAKQLALVGQGVP